MIKTGNLNINHIIVFINNIYNQRANFLSNIHNIHTPKSEASILTINNQNII